MTEKKFLELYKKLNPAQKEAVDAIEGPVMVVAGPGTGKTQILSLRIANILQKTDIPPDAILALTFTESGVYSMRRRLVEIIGSRAYKTHIHTFHGFANEIIKKYPEYFEKIIGFSSISEIEKVKLLEEIIDGLSLKRLKPYGDPHFYLKPLAGMIESLKKEDISPSKLLEVIKKQEKNFWQIPDLYHKNNRQNGIMKGKYSDLLKKLEKNGELLRVYREYEKKLREKKFIDFDDMIMEVLRVLEKEKNLLLLLQEEYQYILADEHQDTNGAQNRLLELLSGFHENPNLFVVGDEKQAIFRFQGASLENFLCFKKRHKNAKVINLTDNYRSPQAVLDASHALISNSTGTDEIPRQKLVSRTMEYPESIRVFSFRTPESECAFIARDILSKIKTDKTGLEKIAVLYRSNKEASRPAEALEGLNIPFVIESYRDIKSDENIWKLILVLRTIGDPTRDDFMAKFVFLDIFGLDIADAVKITRNAKRKKISILESISELKKMSGKNLENKTAVAEIYKKIASWSSLAKSRNAVRLLEIVAQESGILKKALEGGVESLQKLNDFFDFAKGVFSSGKFPELPDLIAYIDLSEKHSIGITSSGNPDAGAVRLMTAHRAKGLEFDYVYIIGLNDGNWGDRREVRYFHLPVKGLMSLGDFDPNDDERRLFYVALTRAKKGVVLSYSNMDMDEESGVRLPSRFLAEMGSADIFANAGEVKGRKRGKENAPIPRSHSDIGKYKLKNKRFLNKLFLDEGLSVSALNNYLDCPWKYFFENLIRLPKAPTKFQSYGTAVHAALSELFSAASRGRPASSGALLRAFRRHLSNQYIGTAEFNELSKKGKESLPGFFGYFGKRIKKETLSEYRIAGVYPENSGDNGKKTPRVMIRGRIDLIETNPDSTVNVVDFKTSKPKSRNELLGKTKKADQSVWRQLVFYKLLLEGDRNRNFKMNRGEIVFTEPDGRGNYRKEIFEIGEENKKEMAELVRKVGGEIYNLSFWNKTCERKNCEYCQLSSNLN